MGQLVIVGAVVDPDVAELLLWSGFTAFVGLIGIYSGLCRDRLEYLCHLPNSPGVWTYVRLISLQLAIIATAAGLFVGSALLLREAGASLLLLFLFQCGMLLADGVHTLVQCFLQRYERRHHQRSDLLYYATLLPELSMQFSRLCHHLHVWYVHGLSISVIDVLLLANTKAAFEALRQRVVTHLNFVRADANLKRRFRAADADELSKLNDCCAICRERMDSAKVLPCGHFFHYACLRSWLEQSNSCPICRASLSVPPSHCPPVSGAGAGGSGAPPSAAAGSSAAAGNDAATTATAVGGVAIAAGHSADGLRRRGVGVGVGDAGGGSAGWEASPDEGAAVAHGDGWGEGVDDGEEGAEGEDDGEEGEDGDEQTLLLFSSENWRWPSWLPRLHLEIIRRPVRVETPASVEAEMARLREVFPQVPELALRRALLRSSSLEVAIETLLEGLEP